MGGEEAEPRGLKSAAPRLEEAQDEEEAEDEVEAEEAPLEEEGNEVEIEELPELALGAPFWVS